MSDFSALPTSWDHASNEAELYAAWEASGAFEPTGDGEPFSILLPPPNANGTLHTGNAMFTIEDIFIRRARMQGKKTVWIPGTDHAGFETQIVFERELEKSGHSRFDFQPDEFRAAVDEFVHDKQSRMIASLKAMGFSLDWSRLYFTLDDNIVAIVNKTFKRLFDDALIYRGKRLVNFCIKHQTSLSDLEIKHVEQESQLITIRYPLSDSEGSIEVATTRPETLFGDMAVAVNPTDERYRQFIGKMVQLPLTERQIPIIADSAVDPTFGTGAVKVTPAHDHTDYEIGLRHQLPLKQVIGFDGRLTDVVPEKYRGLKVKEARPQVMADLEAAELLLQTKPHFNAVATCYKCGNILEPLPKDQWYVKVRDGNPAKSLVDLAKQAVEGGETTIIPERFSHIFDQWAVNMHDWNISRQILWGIPIPAWQCQNCQEWTITEGDTPLHCQNCGGEQLERDPDVFDTWFSSCQLPFAALQAGQPDDFATFYPTTVLETGHDILFFWVTRMLMLGKYVTGQVPFKFVYLHGMVLDRKGQKMSKSKGNALDPLELTAKFGTDALRMALVVGNAPGHDLPIFDEKVKGYRNFANKIWNAGRFVLGKLDGERLDLLQAPAVSLTANEQALKILNQAIGMMTEAMDYWQIGRAGEGLYELFWHSFCDDYLEAAKKLLEADPQAKTETIQTLGYCIATYLKLLHPFMPFVTEALWRQLRQIDPDLDQFLMVSSWPTPKSN